MKKLFSKLFYLLVLPLSFMLMVPYLLSEVGIMLGSWASRRLDLFGDDMFDDADMMDWQDRNGIN